MWIWGQGLISNQNTHTWLWHICGLFPGLIFEKVLAKNRTPEYSFSKLWFSKSSWMDQIVSEYDYDFFCSIKPLYKKENIKVEIQQSALICENWCGVFKNVLYAWLLTSHTYLMKEVHKYVVVMHMFYLQKCFYMLFLFNRLFISDLVYVFSHAIFIYHHDLANSVIANKEIEQKRLIFWQFQFF